MPDMEDTMTVYIIRDETVTAHRSDPVSLSEGEVVIGSAEEIAASGLSLAPDGCDLECAARYNSCYQGSEDGGAAPVDRFRPVAG